MALRHKIEWDPEEVAAGYDLSSIYEGVGDNSTVPVISSVVNTTGQVGPATNITVGLSHLVEEVVKKVVAVAINATPTTSITPASSTPSTVSTVVKKMVEHLGREPISPVATVCISYFCETLNRVHHGSVQYNLYSILQNRINMLRCAVYNNVQIVS